MTMPAPAIRLVCLDLGGVVMRICRGWGEACDAAKVRLPFASLPTATAGRFVELCHDHESGRIDTSAFERLAAKLVGLTPADVRAATQAYIHEPYPGGVGLVARLAASDLVQSACLTNTTPLHWEMMTTPGPFHLGLERLTWRFTSFEIGHMKPLEPIYRHVEQATGLSAPEILFFDDTPANVEVAKGLGWNAELINHQGDPPGAVLSHLERYRVRV